MAPLPDGGVAQSRSGNITGAWYVAPTNRYDHGILGDHVEAGGLAVKTRDGQTFAFELPATHVFEDLTPRIADLDGDGTSEVIAIRSSLTRGAAVAVYGLRSGKLSLLAVTPEIGRAHRWLNIAAIHDFDGDGSREISFVRTPHIAGVLEVWSYSGGKLVKRLEMSGVSNHAIGSRALRLSALLDVDGDGNTELILPDQPHTSLLAISVRSWKAQVISRAVLRAKAAGDLSKSGKTITVPMADGRKASIRAVDFR
ncbi:MAG: hypothetical protein KDJ62_07175 [Rhodobiaceae bacterium]|nr:hypothetical protein [Rhodobiaceae bacterium]